ncbi:hypothetical protein [Rhizobium sp. RAF56]|uniref:hypothetical protein n=1 Tax=Rhizobium sp. RAF56 TaxID=3233062 RepID=UPI003F9CAB7D
MGVKSATRCGSCEFDRSDSAVFTWSQLDGAFGGVQGPTPPLAPDDDPIVGTDLIFADAFKRSTAQ